MDAKTIVVSVVSIAIACLFAVTLLIPVIADSTAETDTFTNEGYFRMTHYDDTTDHVVTWTYEKPRIITVDDVDVEINYNVPSGQVTVIADTNWILRMYCGNTGEPSGISMITPTGGTTSAQVVNNATATINLSNGSMTATIDQTAKSGTYTDLWLPSNDGEFLMKMADKIAYINGDSEIIGYGMSRVKLYNGSTSSSPGYGISLIGTYDDGIVGTVWRGAENGSLSDATINATADGSHDDLYLFDKITTTFTITQTVDEQTVTTDTPLTYNYVIVPYQVTADRLIHPDASTTALLNIIPLFVVMGIILATVGIIAMRK